MVSIILHIFNYILLRSISMYLCIRRDNYKKFKGDDSENETRERRSEEEYAQ